MNCKLFEEHYLDELDGLLDEALTSALQEHKSTCASCRQLYEDARDGLHMVRQHMVVYEPPASLDDRIMAAAREAVAMRSASKELDQLPDEKGGFFAWLNTLLASPSFRPALAFCAVAVLVGSVYVYQSKHQLQQNMFSRKSSRSGIATLKDMAPSAPAKRSAPKRRSQTLALRRQLAPVQRAPGAGVGTPAPRATAAPAPDRSTAPTRAADPAQAKSDAPSARLRRLRRRMKPRRRARRRARRRYKKRKARRYRRSRRRRARRWRRRRAPRAAMKPVARPMAPPARRRPTPRKNVENLLGGGKAPTNQRKDLYKRKQKRADDTDSVGADSALRSKRLQESKKGFGGRRRARGGGAGFATPPPPMRREPTVARRAAPPPPAPTPKAPAARYAPMARPKVAMARPNAATGGARVAKQPSKSSDGSYTSLVNAAALAAQRGQTARAIRLYQKSLGRANNAQRAQIHLELGKLYLLRNDMGNARRNFSRAVSYTPRSRRRLVQERIVRIYRWRGKYQNAANMLRRLKQLYPNRKRRYDAELRRLLNKQP